MKVVFIAGPTASGKSGLALDVAEKTNGFIVNADSVQMYKHLDIGSAKAALAERERVPHFLLDVLQPDQDFTAGDFRRHTLEILKNEMGPAFIVGGSGFYLQALEKGLFQAPKGKPETRAKWEKFLRENGEIALRDELIKKDPEWGCKLNVRDHYRVVRALVIIEESGRKVSQMWEEFQKAAPPFPYPLLKVALKIPRDMLRMRVRERAEHMLKKGWLEEVQKLLDMGFGQTAALKSVGYRECVQFLEGKLNKEELIEQIEISTMQLAKKQMTWLRKDPAWAWFDHNDTAHIRDRILRHLSPV